MLLPLLFIFLLQPVTSRYLYLRAPEPHAHVANLTTSSYESSNPSVFFKQQYENPAEVFSVLLLIGGDIVQKAIAQLVGHQLLGYYITPTAFSFGWVAYAFNALNSALSDGTLMPVPDIVCRVISLASGGSRENESWVIGRLVRDLELSKDLQLPERKAGFTFLTTEGLPGRPQRDKVWWSFIVFLPLQLALAAVPVILPQRNWAILLITAVGSLLAIITGSLPHWMEEKYACRHDSKETFVLTRGNGHQHVFVIENGLTKVVRDKEGKDRTIGQSLNLEDLAIQSPKPTRVARVILVGLAIAWVLFLITAGGIEKDTWYLLGVGGLGMVHNVYTANKTRTPGAHGVPVKEKPLNKCKRIQAEGRGGVMSVLKKAEEERPGLGLAVLKTFFPGRLTQDEAIEWENARDSLDDRRKAFKKGQMVSNPWTQQKTSQDGTSSGVQPSTQTEPLGTGPPMIKRTLTIPSSTI
jgi:hypothetical protein